MKGLADILEEEEYRALLDRIISYEEKRKDGEMKLDMSWEWDDVGGNPGRINKLVELGLVEKTYNSSNYTMYMLKDREHVKELLEEQKEIEREQELRGTGVDELPDDLFDIIVGYEDVKRRFKRALKSGSVRQSVLLIGPRASAKTVFVDEISRVPNVLISRFGTSTTTAGFENEIMERPDIVIIDELDKMENRDVYDVLHTFQDPRQPFLIRKANKRFELEKEKKPPVFATANYLNRIPDTNVDRFWVYKFKRYKKDEFERIAINICQRDFDISEELAKYIADKLYNMGKEINWRDVSIRTLERFAEVVETKEDVDSELEFLKRYS